MERADSLPGATDGYDRLWTPHRMAYIQGESKPVDDKPGHGCPFCAAPQRSDEEGLLVHRGQTCYVVLNLFPYNPGHLLICPYRHVPDLTGMNESERGEMMELTTQAMRVLRKTKQPVGFNFGMNAGEVAGAGIYAHVHQHVVPRWAGDANFLPIVAQTKAIPEILSATRAELSAAWQNCDDGSR